MIMITGGYLMGMNEADPDLWGHSLYGRELIETGTLAQTTTGSFTSIGFRWINHENLAELLTASIEMQFGPAGLVFGKFLLSQVVLGLILFQARRHGVSWFIAGIVTLLAANGLAFHWHVRPQILGYTIFTLMIVGLSWIFQGWEGRWNLRPWRALPLFIHEGVDYHWKRMRCLWLGFPVFGIWTNTHGSFAAGLAIFLAYLFFRCIEALSLWGRPSEGRIRRFALMGLVGILGTVANPYGLGLHQWMFQAIGHPQPEILDWQPIPLLEGEAIPFWALLSVTLFSLRFSNRQKDFTQLAILVLVGWQAISHIRHLTFLALLIALWIPPHLQSVWKKLTTPVEDHEFEACSLKTIRWAVIGMVIIAVGMATQLFHRSTKLVVDTSQYPVAAMKFMEERQLRGRTVVTFNWAQYALACFAQESDPLRRSTVAIDGRYTTCYSPETIDVHFDFLFGKNYSGKRYRSHRSGPINPERALTYKGPELFVLNRNQQGSVRILESHRDRWTLLYQDSLAQIWGLTSRFGTPGGHDYLPEGLRVIGNAPQQGAVPYPALPVLTQRHAQTQNRYSRMQSAQAPGPTSSN